MGRLAGMSLRHVVLALSAAVSVAVVLTAAYCLSGEAMAVYVDRRRLAETRAPPIGASSTAVSSYAFSSHSLATGSDFQTRESPPVVAVRVHSSRIVADTDSSLESDYYFVSESTLPEEKDGEEEGEVEEEESVSKLSSPSVNFDRDTQPPIYRESVANSSKVQPPMPTFTVRKGFTFPHPQVFIQTQKILSAKWVSKLKDYLRSIQPARSLALTVATKGFIPNLLNWLIAVHSLVQPPLDPVLVLGFDKEVHTLLAARKIPCIHVPYSSVLKKGHYQKGVSAIWMTRFAVIRLLNHWGYDVLQLDNDAVPLKNPHLLFDAYSEYDLVGARGILPFELGRQTWGFTLCMGAALLRGTERMETLWQVMHGNKMDKTTDDQKRINFALFKSSLQWGNKEHQFDHASVGTNRDGVRVAVLPRKYICRKTCSLAEGSETVIWHQSGGGHSASWKSKQNLKSAVWFLRPDYDSRSVEPSVTGQQWLERLTLPGSVERVRHKLSPPHTIPQMIAL